MIRNFTLILIAVIMLSSCQSSVKKHSSTMPVQAGIEQATIAEAISAINDKSPIADTALVRKGVVQIASLWPDTDGLPTDFFKFCA